jgi:hypothetical protein
MHDNQSTIYACMLSQTDRQLVNSFLDKLLCITVLSQEQKHATSITVTSELPSQPYT